MAASTVTDKVSVLLISSVGTKVYLSSVGYPGHIVTIKDYTGVASQGNPIVVSTTQNVFFADGSISTLLYNPFSFLTVASKTPTTWQILNNTAFLTTLSNSFVDTLTVANSFLNLVSSTQEFVSTSVIGNINVTNGIELLGNVDILGDIVVNGVVDFFSTLDVKESIYFSSGFTVNGPVSLSSTLNVRDEITVVGDTILSGDIVVGGDLFISSSLRVDRTLVPRFLSVQTMTMSSVIVAGGVEIAGDILTENLFVQSSFVTLGKADIGNNLSILGSVDINGDTTIRGFISTNSLTSLSSGVVVLEASAYSVDLAGILSTASSLYVKESLSVDERTLVTNVEVTGSVCTNSLIVGGNAVISSIFASGNVSISGTMMLFSSFTTGILCNANQSTGIGGSLYASNVIANSAIISTLTGGLTVKNINQPYWDIFPNVFVEDKLSVKGDTYLKEAGIINSLSIGDNASTQTLFNGGDIIIGGDFVLGGIAIVEAVAAPIEIILSTLTLSNTLNVTGSAKIPSLVGTENIPSSITAGVQGNNPGFLLTSTMNIHGIFEDRHPYVDKKSISTLTTSSIIADYPAEIVIGNRNYINPFSSNTFGTIFCGSNTNGSNLFLLGSNNTFSVLPVQFSSIAFGIANDNSNNWIAVGEANQPVSTIQISEDGSRSWGPVTSGGFEKRGRDVVYAAFYSPLWIATGEKGSNTAGIQISVDGRNWSNIPNYSNLTGLSNFNGRRLYFNSQYNYVIAGGNAGGSEFGIFVSYDGLTWFQGQAPGYLSGFDCYDITSDGGSNLYAVGVDSFNVNKLFVNINAAFPVNNWSSESSNLPANLSTLKTIAINTYISRVIGGVGNSGNPFYSIWYGPAYNPSFYSAIESNSSGFSEVNRIKIWEQSSDYLAVGNNSNFFNVQRPNSIVIPNTWVYAISFSTIFSFPSPLYDFSYGPVKVPDTLSPLFIANTETRFASGISTLFTSNFFVMNASSIKASSIQANELIGDASQLTNLQSFSKFLKTSSIQVDVLQWLPQYIPIPTTSQSPPQVPMSIYPLSIFSTITTNTFMSLPSFAFSNQVVWLAAGQDTLTSGNIQNSLSLSNWSRSESATFNVKGNAVAGNSNSNNPFFVATGVDTRTDHTILYSTDGKIWNPIQSGGFTTEDTNGRKTGNTVVHIVDNFFATNPREFLVGGNGPALLRTTDGLNYTEITSGLFGTGIKKLKSRFDNVFALTNENNLVYSPNKGLSWYPTYDYYTVQPLQNISAFGFGTIDIVGGFIAIASNGTFYYPFFFNNFAFYYIPYGIATTPLLNVIDLIYLGVDNFANSNWIALQSNQYRISDGQNILNAWTTGTLGVSPLTSIYSITSNFTSQPPTVFIGAQSPSSIFTLWKSENAGSTWSNITTGGFSSFTNAFGTGYAVAISSPYILLGGTGAFGSEQLPMQPQILRASNLTFPPSPSPQTTILLNSSNAENVFNTSVYGIGIASTNAQLYPFVAVGDGAIPQKTIARSSNLTDWIPAVTGGFTTGRAVTYYYNSTIQRSIWVAVGNAIASTANIQYSSDGANWFPTNNSGGIGLGGYGIAQISSLERLVAVGQAFSNSSPTQPNRTIVYSDDGLNWFNAGNVQGFQEISYGIAAGYKAGTNIGGAAGEYVIAVGRSNTTFGRQGSIQMSSNGVNWSPIISGGFQVAGYGIAYGTPMGQPRWVAVGQNSGSNPTGTIQYSIDGEIWLPATNGFAYGGYGVAYNSSNQIFVATGASGINTTSVLYSQDGGAWFSLQSGGFINEETFGRAEGLFAQSIQTVEVPPFVEFSTLTIYSRATAQDALTIPSIRFQSTNIVFNEAMSVSSGQVMINTFEPFGSNTVTVNGNVETSTLVYKGTEIRNPIITVSSLITSSLQFTGQFAATTLQTPYWAFGISTQANYLGLTYVPLNPLEPLPASPNTALGINNTLYIRQKVGESYGGVGINDSAVKSQQVTIQGTFVCSTLSTSILKQDSINISIPNQTQIVSPFLTITTDNSQNLSNTNVIFSQISSLTFNNILTINQSTQRVGYFTSNPLFDFDARRAGWTSTLTTEKVRTETLFFTLQSF